jgi:hypothetical protein
MIELLMYIVVLILGLYIGYQRKTPEQTECDRRVIELEKEVAYYKKLCLWHVQERDKLKNDN